MVERKGDSILARIESPFFGFAMYIHRTLFSLAFLSALGSFANAQFTVSGAGPYNSWGYQGDPSNSTISATYTGASALFGNLDISGTLTNVAGGLAHDSDWFISNTTRGNSYTVTPSNATTYSTLNVNASVLGLYWLNHNDNFTFEACQNYDNDFGGNDAKWTNVSMTYSSAPIINDLGTLNSATPETFDTISSSFDTVVALYSSNGTLLAQDDDGGGNLTSKLNLGLLGGGNYYFTVAGYGTNYTYDFQNGYAADGDLGGNVVVHLNGNSIYTGTHVGGHLDTFAFTVVPEPSSIAVLGLGIVTFIRRKRK
jgi:hypothetical protein